MSARAAFRCFASCRLWIFSVVMMRPDLVRNPPVQFLDFSRKADSHHGQLFKFRCRRLIGSLAARTLPILSSLTVCLTYSIEMYC